MGCNADVMGSIRPVIPQPAKGDILVQHFILRRRTLQGGAVPSESYRPVGRSSSGWTISVPDYWWTKILRDCGTSKQTCNQP
jgi:hypothetical protein